MYRQTTTAWVTQAFLNHLNLAQYSMNIIHVPLLLLVLAALALNACVTVQPKNSSTQSETVESTSTEEHVSLRTLIKRYEKQAKSATVPANRQYYLLLAAETLMEHNRADIAKRYMNAITESQMESSHQQRLLILKAELDAKNGLYPLALQKLPKKILDYPPKVQVRILTIRAEAFSKLGYLSNSIETRIQLSSRLTNLNSIEDNNAIIWSLLNTMPDPELRDLLKNRSNTGLKAWVQLAIGFRQATDQTSKASFLDKWYQHYPAHPAADSFIETLKIANASTPQYPKNIALLLPLSSKNKALVNVAEAVRDGFLAGHYNQKSSDRPNIKIYDVGNNPEEIGLHHQQAHTEGADIIVGPLDKQAVTNLANTANLDIPVLALNYTVDTTTSSNNVFQFGLLPEDEARQIAEIAIINKQTRAIILTPRSSMGERLQLAFSEHYKQLGGKVLTTELYAPDAKDYSASVQRAFNLLQSKTRNALLSSTISHKIKFEPRRRQDVDIIFLVANPTQARILKPMLAYYNAGDIPAYTTSMAFNGTTNTRQDTDLNGLFFVDQPWILRSSENDAYNALQKHWPQKMQMNARHYALGIDAYRIIPYLNKLKLNPFERFSGLTGSISIDSQNRMHRELIWAQFEKGVPKIKELLALEGN